MDCMMDEAFGGLVLYGVFVAIVQHEKSEICKVNSGQVHNA